MDDLRPARQFLAVVFAMRGQLYALEQHGTATLLPWLQRYASPSGAPGLPDWCLGLLNVRGTVQLVVDLGGLLGLGLSDIVDHSRLIFIEHGSAQLGMLVDREVGVRTLQESASSAEQRVPFIVCNAMLDDYQLPVLDGAWIIHRVARALHAPAYLN